MKARYHDITMRLWLIHDRIRRGNPEPELPVMLPLNEDLGGLQLHEIEQEIAVIERRKELGHIEPEGLDGLNYRLSRLRAQEAAVRKKEQKRNIQ